jgi:ribose/xylose/arabinose/galactoside ABC-type transport system permease subunit
MDINGILSTAGLASAIMTYFVVFAIKKSPLVNNKWLPLISLAIGAFIGLGFGFFKTDQMIPSIIFGLGIGSGAVGLDQIIKIKTKS